MRQLRQRKMEGEGRPLLGIWSIAVNGFILHRAMNATLFIGIFVAISIALLALVLSTAAASR